MAHWLDAPAGKHGRITRKEDKLIYDGQPIKLWGLNVCYSSCAPDKELADRRAKFYAKYGINTVLLSPQSSLDRAALPYFNRRYGPQRDPVTQVFRVR